MQFAGSTLLNLVDLYLLTAASENDTAGVQQAISDNANVNAKNALGESALLMAVRQGNTQMAKLLLAAGAEVDIVTKHGLTPLMVAAKEGHIHTLDVLIQHEANVNARHSYGMTVIGFAIKSLQMKIIQKLIDAGANIENADLLTAAECGNIQAVEYFIDAGIDINYVSQKLSALNVAVRQGHALLVKKLIDRGAHIETVNARKDLNNDLVHAAFNGYTETIKTLISAKATVEWAILTKLKKEHACAVIETLITAGAKIDPLWLEAQPVDIQKCVAKAKHLRLMQACVLWPTTNIISDVTSLPITISSITSQYALPRAITDDDVTESIEDFHVKRQRIL